MSRLVEIWVNEYNSDIDCSIGNSYFATWKEALAHENEVKEGANENAVITCTRQRYFVQMTKAGVLKALTKFGAHADNG